MLTLSVQNMTCNHCIARVTKAIQSISPDAKVSIELATKTVTVNGNVDANTLIAAITEAGYPAQVK